jgi:hypothetical protein
MQDCVMGRVWQNIGVVEEEEVRAGVVRDKVRV